VIDWIKARLAFLVGYLRNDTPQSSARLCAIILTLTGCAVAIGSMPMVAYGLYKQLPWAHDLMGDAAKLVAALIGGGAVAIFCRKGPTEGSQ
jgi:hypothetical protein